MYGDCGRLFVCVETRSVRRKAMRVSAARVSRGNDRSRNLHIILLLREDKVKHRQRKSCLPNGS